MSIDLNERAVNILDFLNEINGNLISFTNEAVGCEGLRHLPQDFQVFMSVIGRCSIGSDPLNSSSGFQIVLVDRPVNLEEAHSKFVEGESELFVWDEFAPNEDVGGFKAADFTLVANDVDNQMAGFIHNGSKYEFFTNSVYSSNPPEKTFTDWFVNLLRTFLFETRNEFSPKLRISLSKL